ncbi:MAG: 30S ribosomal protein S16 [Chloroflexota bacterium]|nr:30S ribosomal protein S16 [Chloroflexota bacterium]
MAVRIRLTRVGATKRPSYRVIAIDKRRSRDGRALEILGFYDPLTEPATVNLETDRIHVWIGKGAQPSETVAKLMRQAERAAQQPVETEKPKRPARTTKPKAASRATSDKPPAADPVDKTAAASTTADEGTPAASTDAAGPEKADT